MEAVFDFGRNRQKLVTILRGCEEGGGNRHRLAPLIAFIGVGCERGRRRAGRGENKFVLALNAAVCM
jgi:hypothetical protein